MDTAHPLTVLLDRIRAEEPGASDAFYEAVYQDLKRIAGKLMAQERVGHTLQPTALVNQLWLRFQAAAARCEDRKHFFYAAGLAMRRILIDHARKRMRRLEGQVGARSPLDDVIDQMAETYPDNLVLEEALETLRRRSPQRHEAFVMTYFAGRPEAEIADYLGLSVETVQRYLRTARAELSQGIRPTSP
jgi:RNA polymerase sigma factor (TIGR02999 family)